LPPHAMPARASLPCPADGWAILADPPGRRDLVEPGYWAASLERSRRRRAVRREPRLIAAGRAKASVALAAAALGGPAAGAASAESTSGGSLGAVDLSLGSRGTAVRVLQRDLGVASDGIFGSQTERAVLRFQRSHGLPVTGLVGPLTRAALGQSAPAEATAGASATTTAPVLGAGTVRAIQNALGVTADGIMGPQTRAALSRYESEHGLPADGQPDASDLQALGVSSNGAADPSAPAPAAPATQPSAAAQTAVAAALSKVGAPYRYGGTGPDSFDCSGLVMWALGQAGVSVPHSSYAQYGLGKPVAGSAIAAGDLVFFNTAGGGASDVGFATGPDTAVSATTHGVMTHPIHTGYWGDHFVGARRLG
jgi:cell wall-associated NlpC family hydrolase